MVRAFRRDAIEDDKVWRILRNAWRAPSAGHLEPQDFVVVRDEGIKKRLAEAALGQSFIGEAPVVNRRLLRHEEECWKVWGEGEELLQHHRWLLRIFHNTALRR